MARTKSIGVFDSGFGGLSILKEIVKVLPNYRYVYLGDNARVPYGMRSSEIVYKFTEQAVDFLLGHDCDLIIIACNTSSADALRKIQREYLPGNYSNRKRVLGVIVPAIEEAIDRTKNHRVGVLATESTVASRTYPREMRVRDPRVTLFQNAAPLLAPLVEAGEHNSAVARSLLRQYLRPLMKKNIDTLILGCTHYGHLARAVRKIVDRRVSIISEGPVVAKKLKNYLFRHPEIESNLSRKKTVKFYTTDISDRFHKLGALFFGRRISAVKVELE